MTQLLVTILDNIDRWSEQEKGEKIHYARHKTAYEVTALNLLRKPLTSKVIKACQRSEIKDPACQHTCFSFPCHHLVEYALFSHYYMGRKASESNGKYNQLFFFLSDINLRLLGKQIVGLWWMLLPSLCFIFYPFLNFKCFVEVESHFVFISHMILLITVVQSIMNILAIWRFTFWAFTF